MPQQSLRHPIPLAPNSSSASRLRLPVLYQIANRSPARLPAPWKEADVPSTTLKGLSRCQPSRPFACCRLDGRRHLFLFKIIEAVFLVALIIFTDNSVVF